MNSNKRKSGGAYRRTKRLTSLYCRPGKDRRAACGKTAVEPEKKRTGK